MLKKKITQSEFISTYCYRSKIMERALNKLGTFAVPCDCDEENCQGWAMVSRENLKTHCNLYINEKE